MDIGRSGRAAREAALGPAYFYHRRLLNESKEWSRGKVDAYQATQLERAVMELGPSVRTRMDYIANPTRYRRGKVPGLLRPVTTSGTTGQPMLFWQDRVWARQKERAYIFDIWADTGYRPFDTRVVFRGRLGRRPIEYSPFENAYYLSPAHLNVQTRVDALAELRKLRGFFLHAYPSSLRTLIDLLGPEEFLRLPVRGVLLGSEAVLPGQIEQIEEMMRLPVAYWYGHSEYAILAVFRQETKSYHFYPTYGAIELGKSVGTSRQILATSYNYFGTRFVRYDTGDLAEGEFLLPSGRDQFTRVADIIGRAQDLIVGRDGFRKPLTAFFFGIHDRIWSSVSDVQFVQTKPGQLTAKVVVKDEAKKGRIEDILQDRFGSFDLRVEWTDRIEKTLSGKHRYFIGMPNEPILTVAPHGSNEGEG